MLKRGHFFQGSTFRSYLAAWFAWNYCTLKQKSQHHNEMNNLTYHCRRYRSGTIIHPSDSCPYLQIHTNISSKYKFPKCHSRTQLVAPDNMYCLFSARFANSKYLQILGWILPKRLSLIHFMGTSGIPQGSHFSPLPSICLFTILIFKRFLNLSSAYGVMLFVS